MDLSFYNYISIGVLSTGLSVYAFRWIRSLKSKKCHCILSKRKTIVITGATSGLGKSCAYEFAKRNCKLILGCRNTLLGQQLVDKLNKHEPIATFIHLDLSDLDSIKRFADRLAGEKIDALINNAGVMTGHFRMVKSTGTEEDMTVNYLGPFHLTLLLLPNLSVCEPTDKGSDISVDSSRIIFVSSSICKRGELETNNLDFSKKPYSPMQAYANSKLALCLFSRDLHRRLHQSISGCHNINVITMFTGGMVHTGLGRHVISNYSILLQPLLKFVSWLFLKDPADVCHGIVHCAISDDLKHSSGELYSDFKVIPWPNRVTESMNLSPDLWRKSCDIVGRNERDIAQICSRKT